MTEEDLKARDAAKAAAEHGIWGREPWLQPLLVRLGCPAIDPRFADLVGCLPLPEPLEVNDPREALLKAIGKVVVTAELGLLRPSEMDSHDAEKLFGENYSCTLLI